MQLDAERLRDLQVFSRGELAAIGRGSVDAIRAQLATLERATGESDLGVAAEAAHRARNETLLIGASELGEAFQSVEAAARAGRASDAREAAATARELWPATRAAIARATYGATA